MEGRHPSRMAQASLRFWRNLWRGRVGTASSPIPRQGEYEYDQRERMLKSGDVGQTDEVLEHILRPRPPQRHSWSGLGSAGLAPNPRTRRRLRLIPAAPQLGAGWIDQLSRSIIGYSSVSSLVIRRFKASRISFVSRMNSAAFA